MATARDIIAGALRLIGASATGESPQAQEQTDTLAALNDMLDSWSAEGLVVPNKSRDTIQLVGSQAAYTVGPSASASLNTARPLEYVQALIQVAGTNPLVEIPIEIINVAQYSSITVKTVTAPIPTRMYAESTFPLDTLNLWPVPSDANLLVIYSMKPLGTIANASTTLSYPAGYQEALRYNLAKRLAPEYGASLTPEAIEIAAESLATIKRRNIKEILMTSDVVGGAGRRFNIYTGEGG